MRKTGNVAREINILYEYTIEEMARLGGSWSLLKDNVNIRTNIR